MSHCEQCGLELESGANFCIQCGHRARPEAACAGETLGLRARFDAGRPLDLGMAVLPLALVPDGDRVHDVRLIVSSPAWSKPRRHRLPALERHRETVIQVPVDPEKSGQTMFTLTLTFLDADGLVHCLSGEGGPIVVSTTADRPPVPNIEVDAEGAVVGDLSGLAAQPGQVSIKSKGMVVLNMDEYAGSQPERRARWVGVPLTYQKRIVEDLRQSQLSTLRCPYCSHQQLAGARRCPACDVACPTYVHKSRASPGGERFPTQPIVDLKLTCHQTQREHLIFTGNVVRFGRMRRDPKTGRRPNEVVLRLYPETARNEQRTLRISRNHARLRVEREQLKLRILRSVPGQVRDADTFLLRDGSVIPFLEELSLKFRVFETTRRKPAETTEETSADHASERFLLSSNFVRADSYGPLETYLLLRREAELVQNTAGRLRWGGLGTPLFRLVKQDQAVWVEDFSERGDVWIDEHRVARDELVRLAPGSLLRVGDFSFEVSPLE